MSIMKLWMMAVSFTFIPLVLLTRWAMSMQRGAGPQGGEVLFLCYLGLWMWMITASLATTVIYTSSLPLSPLVRFILIPVGVLTGIFVLLIAVACFLNHASLSDISEARSRVENILAFALQAVILVANWWALSRRM